ncbi:MAG: serine/threonine-protein kinase, partial [Rhodospirillaceae bacterium]
LERGQDMNTKTIVPLPATIGSAIGTIEQVALCIELDDYFAANSRASLGQIFRPYLDAQHLTPTELLHSYKALTSLLSQHGLVEAAITRIVALQARLPGQDLRRRREAILAAMDDIVARAARAERTLDDLASKGAPLAMLRQSASVPDATPDAASNRDYLLRFAIYRDLAGVHDLTAKLDMLVGLANDNANERLATLVDGGIADLFGTATVLSEMFGPHLFLGEQIRQVLNLALTETSQPSDTTRKPQYDLNSLLVTGRLPETRAALLERTRLQLRSAQPLGSGRNEEDIRFFQNILSALVTPDGVAGGGAMAEALVMRYGRRLNQGGATGARLSIQGIVETLPNLFSRLHFLVALATTETGVKAKNDLVCVIDGLANNTMLLEKTVMKPFDPQGLSEQLERAALNFEQTGLSHEIKAHLRKRITGLVDSFVTNGDFLEIMDQAEPQAPRRIQYLNAIIAAGLVSPNGGRPLIEQHIARIGGGLPAGATAAQNQTAPQNQTMRLGKTAPQNQTVRLGKTAPQNQTVRLGKPAPLDNTLRLNQPAQPTVVVLNTQIMTLAPSSQTAARPNDRQTRQRCLNCFEYKIAEGMCMVCGHDKDEPPRSGVHLQPGAMLENRYMIGHLIGQGGFGATYLGWDDRLQVKVAIKEYFPVSIAGRNPSNGALMPYTEDHVETFKAGIVKFLEEARLLARLRDVKEIVEVHDHFEANDTAYLVMELLVGRTLQRHLLEEGGTIDYRRALGLILPIAKAVHDVHQLGLVHRDISPDNIFLLDKGGTKLLDFGAARHSVGEATGALTVILKRGYAPPEQYSPDGNQGAWTDVYALCASFYCAITGHPPADATARWANEGNLPRPSELGIAIPRAIEDALLTGLALRWQDRPRDMKTLLQALSRALSAG